MYVQVCERSSNPSPCHSFQKARDSERGELDRFLLITIRIK
jgi:hypothetical protein